jgi:hypothetical protein
MKYGSPTNNNIPLSGLKEVRRLRMTKASQALSLMSQLLEVATKRWFSFQAMLGGMSRKSPRKAAAEPLGKTMSPILETMMKPRKSGRNMKMTTLLSTSMSEVGYTHPIKGL